MLTKIPQEVVAAVADLPVRHLSFSSVKKYHESPSLWFREYVHGIRDFDTSPSSVVGTAVHYGIEMLLHAFKRGEVSAVDLPENLERLQVTSLAKFERIVAGKDEDKRVTKINWGKTGSPEKSSGDVVQCSRNAFAAVCQYLADWEIIAVEVKYDSLDCSSLGIPLPVSSVLDFVAVNRTHKTARVGDWKTVAALSPDIGGEDEWDNAGLRRMQAGAYYKSGRATLDAAGFSDYDLDACDFVEIHRGKGGASGVVSQVLPIVYSKGEESEAVQVWAEMARRCVVGMYAYTFLPQLCPLPMNLSSEYGAADAFKLLQDEMANPDETLLTQIPTA